MSELEAKKIAFSSYLKNGVTIGIPLYNEENFIEIAVRSAARQCQYLLISDNGSTDKSFEICQLLAREYKNITIFRQPKNEGSAKNFKFLLDNADTPFFMWLGAHDKLPENYVEVLLAQFKLDDSAGLAFGSVINVDRFGKEISRYDYFFARLLADSQPSRRFCAIVIYLHDCSLIHGLFKTAQLKNIWTDSNYLGSDHVILARLAYLSKLIYQPTIALFRRDLRSQDSPSAQWRRISGHDFGAVKDRRLTKRQMQKALFSMAKEIAPEKHFSRWVFVAKIYLSLISRFGDFSDSSILSILEIIFYNISRIKRIITMRSSRHQGLVPIDENR